MADPNIARKVHGSPYIDAVDFVKVNKWYVYTYMSFVKVNIVCM